MNPVQDLGCPAGYAAAKALEDAVRDGVSQVSMHRRECTIILNNLERSLILNGDDEDWIQIDWVDLGLLDERLNFYGPARLRRGFFPFFILLRIA